MKLKTNESIYAQVYPAFVSLKQGAELYIDDSDCTDREKQECINVLNALKQYYDKDKQSFDIDRYLQNANESEINILHELYHSGKIKNANTFDDTSPEVIAKIKEIYSKI